MSRTSSQADNNQSGKTHANNGQTHCTCGKGLAKQDAQKPKHGQRAETPEKPVLEKAAPERPAQVAPVRDIDGRPALEGHRDRLSTEWGSLSPEEIQASRQLVTRDFADFKILDGQGNAQSVKDEFDHAARTGQLSADDLRDVNTALALVREHYASLRHNGQILPDQAANWTHTMGELARVLQSAEANKLTANEPKLALMASMFSDSAKYTDTLVTKGNFFTHHLDGAISANLHNLGLSEVERNIVTNAILAHQISPPEFMGKLYYMRAAGSLNSLDPNSAEYAHLKELLDPNTSPYIGRSQDGKPTLAFIQEAGGREAHLIPGQGYVLNLNPSEQALLRATGNENWYVPRDPAKMEGFDKLPAAEQQRLLTLDRVTKALLAGDNAQYGTVDSAYKFVVIRGPGTFFPDRNVFDSLESIKSSFDDAYTVLSPIDQNLAAQNLANTQNAFKPGGDVRARMDAAVKEEFGTTDVAYYGKPLTTDNYPKLAAADQAKLNDMAKRFGEAKGNLAEQQAIRQEAQDLTGLDAEKATNIINAIRIKNTIARVLRMEASMDPANVSDDFASVRPK
jgi:hypothetical protein